MMLFEREIRIHVVTSNFKRELEGLLGALSERAVEKDSYPRLNCLQPRPRAS